MWPADPLESSKLSKKLWASIDDLIRKGMIRGFGYFLEGASGYATSEGEAADTFRNIRMFSPFIELKLHEIIRYEKAKETIRALWKALATAKK